MNIYIFQDDRKRNETSEDEIIESDIELDGASIEPDNDPPPKVMM